MNITLEKKDALNAILKISITPEDYTPRVNSELKKYQKQAKVPGFRQGNAPMGMVKKMAGKNIFIEEVNRLATEKMFEYLRNNNYNILAQPLLSHTENSDIDFSKEGDFLFCFDIGMAPEFELNISEKDQITAHKVIIDDKMIDEEVENIRKRYADLEKVETAEEKDVIYFEATELSENNTPLEGGVSAQKISVLPELVKNEELKSKLIGFKLNDTMVADIFELFNQNETVISSNLGLPKEGIKDLNKNFELKAVEIQRHTPANLVQEFFDKIFGPGAVSSEEEFRAKIAENLKAYYDSESDQMVEHEINHLITDNHPMELPEEFLKRWLIETKPESYNKDNVDEKFSTESNHLRYILVQEKIVSQFGLEVSQEEMNNTAIAYTAQLFRNYGIHNPDFQTVKSLAEQNMKDEKFLNKIKDIALRTVVTKKLKTLVTLVDKEVTMEEYYDMVKKHNEMHHAHESHSHEHEHAEEHEHSH